MWIRERTSCCYHGQSTWPEVIVAYRVAPEERGFTITSRLQLHGKVKVETMCSVSNNSNQSLNMFKSVQQMQNDSAKPAKTTTPRSIPAGYGYADNNNANMYMQGYLPFFFQCQIQMLTPVMLWVYTVVSFKENSQASFYSCASGRPQGNGNNKMKS
jgi:hypothetical protein